MELTRYEEARRALAECASIDEVKDIQDKSEAMRLYAKMSENTDLEVYASTIKLRAQVRLGEIIASMETAKNQHVPAVGRATKTQNLADAGISKSSANRYEQLASVPETTIEKIIAESTEAKKPVSMAKILNIAKPPTSKTPSVKPKPPAPLPEVVSTESEKQPDGSTVLPDGMIHVDKAEYQELLDGYQETLADNETMTKVIDADDQLKAAVETIKQLKARNEALETRMNGIMVEKNEAVKLAKSWKHKFEKLEKEIKAEANKLPM